jgi:hypothetical protein
LEKKILCKISFAQESLCILFIQNQKKSENSQKYGWCKMKLLEKITTLITSNLFFEKFGEKNGECKAFAK